MVSTLSFSRTKLCNHSLSVHGNWANHIIMGAVNLMARSEISIIRDAYFEFTPVSIHRLASRNLAWWSMRTKTSVSMLRMTITGVLLWHAPTTKFAWNMPRVSASSCPHLYGILQCTWSYHTVIWWCRDYLFGWCLSTRFGAWFHTGQHFNRCTRIHPLFAVALQILHFRHFIEMHGHGAVSDECIALLKSFADETMPDSLCRILESASVDALLQRYEQFCDQTRRT